MERTREISASQKILCTFAPWLQISTKQTWETFSNRCFPSHLPTTTAKRERQQLKQKTKKRTSISLNSTACVPTKWANWPTPSSVTLRLSPSNQTLRSWIFSHRPIAPKAICPRPKTQSTAWSHSTLRTCRTASRAYICYLHKVKRLTP